ncbi:MAG: GNAT family N-acetyltransferase [Candidatus Obscuribacter sp.]|nr:GNAT family N-acetyltransferase [Candidatus Obscuribacter sp.]
MAELNSKIVGFCEVVPALEELRAIYVDPEASRQGVGQALLHALEEAAQKNNCKRLWLDSSLTAVSFYTTHGFINDGPGEHVLNSGQKMLCVKMHKDLSNL